MAWWFLETLLRFIFPSQRPIPRPGHKEDDVSVDGGAQGEPSKVLTPETMEHNTESPKRVSTTPKESREDASSGSYIKDAYTRSAESSNLNPDNRSYPMENPNTSKPSTRDSSVMSRSRTSIVLSTSPRYINRCRVSSGEDSLKSLSYHEKRILLSEPSVIPNTRYTTPYINQSLIPVDHTPNPYPGNYTDVALPPSDFSPVQVNEETCDVCRQPYTSHEELILISPGLCRRRGKKKKKNNLYRARGMHPSEEKLNRKLNRSRDSALINLSCPEITSNRVDLSGGHERSDDKDDSEDKVGDDSSAETETFSEGLKAILYDLLMRLKRKTWDSSEADGNYSTEDEFLDESFRNSYHDNWRRLQKRRAFAEQQEEKVSAEADNEDRFETFEEALEDESEFVLDISSDESAAVEEDESPNTLKSKLYDFISTLRRSISGGNIDQAMESSRKKFGVDSPSFSYLQSYIEKGVKRKKKGVDKEEDETVEGRDRRRNTLLETKGASGYDIDFIKRIQENILKDQPQNNEEETQHDSVKEQNEEKAYKHKSYCDSSRKSRKDSATRSHIVSGDEKEVLRSKHNTKSLSTSLLDKYNFYDQDDDTSWYTDVPCTECIHLDNPDTPEDAPEEAPVGASKSGPVKKSSTQRSQLPGMRSSVFHKKYSKSDSEKEWRILRNIAKERIKGNKKENTEKKDPSVKCQLSWTDIFIKLAEKKKKLTEKKKFLKGYRETKIAGSDGQNAESQMKTAEIEEPNAEREEQKAEREGETAEREEQKAEREGQKAEREEQKAEREGQKAETEEQKTENKGQQKEIKETVAETNEECTIRQGQQAEVEGQKAKVEGQKAEVEGLKAEVQGQRAEFEGLKAEVQGQKAEFERLKAKVVGQKVEVEGQKAEVEVLKVEVQGQKAKVEGLKAEVEGQKAEVEGQDSENDEEKDISKRGPCGQSQGESRPCSPCRICPEEPPRCRQPEILEEDDEELMSQEDCQDVSETLDKTHATQPTTSPRFRKHLNETSQTPPPHQKGDVTAEGRRAERETKQQNKGIPSSGREHRKGLLNEVELDAAGAEGAETKTEKSASIEDSLLHLIHDTPLEYLGLKILENLEEYQNRNRPLRYRIPRGRGFYQPEHAQPVYLSQVLTLLGIRQPKAHESETEDSSSETADEGDAERGKVDRSESFPRNLKMARPISYLKTEAFARTLELIKRDAVLIPAHQLMSHQKDYPPSEIKRKHFPKGLSNEARQGDDEILRNWRLTGKSQVAVAKQLSDTAGTSSPSKYMFPNQLSATVESQGKTSSPSNDMFPDQLSATAESQGKTSSPSNDMFPDQLSATAESQGETSSPSKCIFGKQAERTKKRDQQHKQWEKEYEELFNDKRKPCIAGTKAAKREESPTPDVEICTEDAKGPSSEENSVSTKDATSDEGGRSLKDATSDEGGRSLKDTTSDEGGRSLTDTFLQILRDTPMGAMGVKLLTELEKFGKRNIPLKFRIPSPCQFYQSPKAVPVYIDEDTRDKVLTALGLNRDTSSEEEDSDEPEPTPTPTPTPTESPRRAQISQKFISLQQRINQGILLPSFRLASLPSYPFYKKMFDQPQIERAIQRKQSIGGIQKEIKTIQDSAQKRLDKAEISRHRSARFDLSSTDLHETLRPGKRDRVREEKGSEDSKWDTGSWEKHQKGEMFRWAGKSRLEPDTRRSPVETLNKKASRGVSVMGLLSNEIEDGNFHPHQMNENILEPPLMDSQIPDAFDSGATGPMTKTVLNEIISLGQKNVQLLYEPTPGSFLEMDSRARPIYVSKKWKDNALSFLKIARDSDEESCASLALSDPVDEMNAQQGKTMVSWLENLANVESLDNLKMQLSTEPSDHIMSIPKGVVESHRELNFWCPSVPLPPTYEPPVKNGRRGSCRRGRRRIGKRSRSYGKNLLTRHRHTWCHGWVGTERPHRDVWANSELDRSIGVPKGGKYNRKLMFRKKITLQNILSDCKKTKEWQRLSIQGAEHKENELDPEAECEKAKRLRQKRGRRWRDTDAVCADFYDSQLNPYSYRASRCAHCDWKVGRTKDLSANRSREFLNCRFIDDHQDPERHSSDSASCRDGECGHRSCDTRAHTRQEHKFDFQPQGHEDYILSPCSQMYPALSSHLAQNSPQIIRTTFVPRYRIDQSMLSPVLTQYSSQWPENTGRQGHASFGIVKSTSLSSGPQGLKANTGGIYRERDASKNWRHNLDKIFHTTALPSGVKPLATTWPENTHGRASSASEPIYGYSKYARKISSIFDYSIFSSDLTRNKGISNAYFSSYYLPSLMRNYKLQSGPLQHHGISF